MIEIHENLSGLRGLARSVTGRERIHVGIRPFGLHAGNVVSLICYPWLLCEEFSRRGGTPEFEIYVSINDWEQHRPWGVDVVRYPYNILPEHSTFQYTPHESGTSMVDHWQPIIEAAYEPLKAVHPGVRVVFRRNSALKRDAVVPRLLRATLSHGREIAELLAREGQYEMLLDDEVRYASAVCPSCRYARGSTDFRPDDTVDFSCVVCGRRISGPYQEFDYWWHHKPLFVARWFAWNFDISISGGDHNVDNDGFIRDGVRAILGMPPKPLTMLFAPMVTDGTGLKMSKSAANEVMVDVQTALEVCRREERARIPIEVFQ